MKFSIRDLLLVTVIVALAVAWWVDRSRLAKEIRNKDPGIINFKATILEQILTERGVTIEVPSEGILILTENGKTQERRYSW